MTYRLTFTSPAADLVADDTARTLTGLVLPYGEVGRTSAGHLTAGPGSVIVPDTDQLRRVKLFDRHDTGRTEPVSVGYATAAGDTPAGLVMTFAVARGAAGDAALLDAAEGTRDALSVELDDLELDGSRIASSTLRAVAQVPVPAFASARLVASDTPTEGEPVSTTETTPREPDVDDEELEQEQPEPEQPEQPASTGTLNAGRTRGRTRATLTAASSAVSRALTGVSDAGTANARLNAALADITPANAGTDVLMRPQWIGELWTPQADRRPMITLFGSSPLTSMTWEGWRWKVYPTVDDYAGNKTAIPTSPAQIEPASGTAHRIAGGWDLDRIYVDFPTGFLDAFWQAAVRSYRIKSEEDLAAVVLAAAGTPATAASVPAAVTAVVQDLLANGATADGVFMASDVWAEWLSLPEAEIPWWVKGSGSVSLRGESTSLADVTVSVDPSLPAGTVLAADRDAVDFRETGPIRVEAVNIPLGGIDLALFGYQGHIVQNAVGVSAATVTITAPAAAKRGK